MNSNEKQTSIFTAQSVGIAEAMEPRPVKTQTAAHPDVEPVSAHVATTATPAAPAKEAPAPPALPDVLKNRGIDMRFLMQPRKAFLAAGGSEQEFAREVNFAIQILMDNPSMVECAVKNPDHFVEAIKSVALTKLSLNPALKLAYLVPRKGCVRFQSSYMGKREILMRAGVVQWIEANLVFEGDHFEVRKGTVSEISHIPDYFGENRTRENLKGGYWVAVLPNGRTVFDVMPGSRIEEIRKRSESVKAGKSSPWDTDALEMARKTVINAAFNQLPKTGISEDMIRGIEAMNKADNEDFEDWKASLEKKDTFAEDGKFTAFEDVKS